MNKKKLVNWADCMTLSAGQFIQSENYFLSALAETAHLVLNNHSYGLLPLPDDGNLYNGVRINEHVTGHIEVQLHRCLAVTASGFRIDFDAKETDSPLVKIYSPGEDKNAHNRDICHWDIILLVDPFTRVASGELDPDEVPPRHPDSESTYALYIMPVGHISAMEFGRHHLTIGRIRKDGEQYVVDGDYIPPSASMSSHPELLEYFGTFSAMFVSIEKSSKLIMEKIHNRSERSDLAVNLKLICGDVLRLMAQRYFALRNRGRYAPPIELVDHISSFAHTFYVSLVSLSTHQKEEVLKYFYEWTDVTPGSFEDMATDMLNMTYAHDNLRTMMVGCEHFLRTFTELWARMSRLEYIGQHKESIIVSEQRQEKDRHASEERSWNIME